MIGKPEWFEPRTSGWGMRPVCWQGWVYVGCTWALVVICALTPVDERVRLIMYASLIAFLLIDGTDIMIRMPKDERDILHEALAERNAAWFMISALVFWFLYQVLQTVLTGIVHVSWLIPIVLLCGALVKTATYWYLNR